MKLLYKAMYFGRILFVLEHKKKILMVYKSSGLSGTGHEGQIIPFMFLNSPDSKQSLRDTPGYIYKEMYYNGVIMNHRKQLYKYPEALENMNTISEFLTKKKLDEYDIKHDDWYQNAPRAEDLYDYIIKVNKALHHFADGKEFWDLKQII